MPTEIGSLTDLTRLSFDANDNLGGTVPTELVNLRKLERLNLDGTALVGQIEFLCDLPKLQDFRVDRADLNCSCCGQLYVLNVT